ncbi:MAG: hypothetical protein AAF828_07845 [Bacteroidota bacterium]
MHFFDFELISQPAEPANSCVADPNKSLLVIHRAGAERKAFLFNVLKAAGYDAPETQIHQITTELTDLKGDVSTLIRRLGVQRLLIFGLPLASLGLRLQIAPYVPVKINHCWLMVGDDLSIIEREKAAGNTQKAAALWKAIKASFLVETTK